MSQGDDQRNLQKALRLHQAGELDRAADLYRQVLKTHPENSHALHCLGIVVAAQGNVAQAKSLMARSLATQPQNIRLMQDYATVLVQSSEYKSALQICQQGLQSDSSNVSLLYVSAVALFKLKRLERAIAQFDRLLSLQPDHLAAINERGCALAHMKEFDAALASFGRALTLEPRYADAHLNTGNVYGSLKRHREAIDAYDKALALRPDLIDAWIGRGNVFLQRKDCQEALAAYDKALALRPDSAGAWLGRGNAFYELKQYGKALAAYDKALALEPDLAAGWLRRGNASYELRQYREAFAAYDSALALESDMAIGWFRRGNALAELQRDNEALGSYDRALALKPDLAEAWLGRGNVCFRLGLRGDSFAAYNKALALGPEIAEAWQGRGNVFRELGRHDAAFADYDRGFQLKPHLPGVEGDRLGAKMQLCDWSGIEADRAHLIASVRNGHRSTSPFPFLAVSASADDHLRCARQWDASTNVVSAWQGAKYRHHRIRVAYLSADFRQHAVCSLAVPVFERHDRSRFEVAALSVGADDGSDMRRRAQVAFEHFIDVRSRSDDEVCRCVKGMEIDILVDMMGFTRDTRTNILARRPAPIQVNYLGFPGTMGVPYIDYIIADSVVTPEDRRGFYSERVVCLPNSFMPRDRECAARGRTFTRADAGLPPESFVFCCFNNTYKFTPALFDVWMRILKAIEGSVLWFVTEIPTVEHNLRGEAAARGVDVGRLIVAQHLPLAEYQARLHLADVFLDTAPYNAGAVASDALWAGLPVLTLMGDSLVGRMGASQLKAAGLDELITCSLEEYETLALKLARQPNHLAWLKEKLALNRNTCPLFDAERYVRHIETAYTAMHARWQAGLAPDHIDVPTSGA
jgi:protein O-GlcNAc transferase